MNLFIGTYIHVTPLPSFSMQYRSGMLDYRMESKINVGRCEVARFSAHTNNTQEDWSPVITLAGKILKHDLNPRLLCVILDRWMTLSAHINKMKDSLQQSYHQLQAKSHSYWGWNITNLCAIFYSLIHTCLEYAGPAWLPKVSKDNMRKFESLQSLVTGQLQSTSLKALNLEAYYESTSLKALNLEAYYVPTFKTHSQ